MTKNDAINLAIDSLHTTLGTWIHSPNYETVKKNVSEAIEILNKLKDHPYLDVEKYYQEEDR